LPTDQPTTSLAVCFPVWNRPDLFKVCFDSLTQNLSGLNAGIWIFDNGSGKETRELIESLESPAFPLFKIYLPRNMGIPYVANIFSQMIAQDCAYSGLRAPSHVMLADADAYFKLPIYELIELLETNDDVGIVSGHDSPEHPTLRQHLYQLKGGPIVAKEKTIERGTSLVMRSETLAACVPFPHDVSANVDWQLMLHGVNSMAARKLKVLAVDHVVHLGVYESTWSATGIPADQADLDEINRVLADQGLLTPSRKEKMQSYRGLVTGVIEVQ